MTYPHREFNDDHTPLAYLITFRDPQPGSPAGVVVAAMEPGVMAIHAALLIVFTTVTVHH